MLYNALKLLHVLSIIVWVGGMAFAHFFLRPAVQQLAPAERVPLMRAILQRFLAAVGASVVVVLTTGLALIGMVSMGGGFVMPWDWKFMSGVGLLMMAIYAYIYLALLSRLDTAVQAADWAAGGDALARIRTWVGINLLLGTAIVVVVLLW